VIDIQKLAVPLSITAAVVGIYVFLHGQPQAPVAGALPQPMTVPTFSAFPFSPLNIATLPAPPNASSPTPASAPASGTPEASAPFLPYTPPGGLVVNGGAGQTFATASYNSAYGTTSTDSCCDPCGTNASGKRIAPYVRQIAQSAVL
jgi:hypothetical protein